MTAPPHPRMLRLRVVDDAVLVPRTDTADRSQGAGVLQRTAEGLTHVRAAGVRRRGREYVPPPSTDAPSPARRVDAAVFAGFLFAHYGHFLLESLGRLWFDGITDVPLVWIAGTASEFRPWMSEMLDELGLPADRIVVDGCSGPLEVGELLVPDQGFEVHRYLHPWLLSRLATHPARPDPGHRRLWLSRSGLGDLAGVEQEPQIEAALAAEGWTVVHPERLPLARQIDLLAGASHIAGIEGSAFHTLLFVEGYRGTVDILTRHGSPNFELIAQAAGWDQVRHPMPGGRADEWNRPSGARDVRWSDVDVETTVRTIIGSSCR